MNIQPGAAAASIAGVGRAAARGGQHDHQVADSTRQQSTASMPAGKSPDASAVDAGEATSDRGGDGRQTYDHFTKHDQDSESDSTTPTEPNVGPSAAEHIDFLA